MARGPQHACMHIQHACMHIQHACMHMACVVRTTSACTCTTVCTWQKRKRNVVQHRTCMSHRGLPRQQISIMATAKVRVQCGVLECRRNEKEKPDYLNAEQTEIVIQISTEVKG